MSRLRGTKGSADDGALDLAEGPPGRSPCFERFFGGDEVPGRRAFEIDEAAQRIVMTTADELLRRYTPANAGATTVLCLPAA